VKNPTEEVPAAGPRVDGGRRFYLPLMLIAALLGRLAAVARLSPASDVYYYLSQGVKALISGGNPYEHTYTGIPLNLVTPGAHEVFAYLPVTLFYLVPFYLLGDVRFGLIVADLLVGACLYLYGGRLYLQGAFLYLFLPFTVIFSTYYLNATLIAMALIALFLLLESRGRSKVGAVSFGAALATVQFTALIAPFVLFYYAQRRKWTEVGIAAALAAVSIVPFFLASPSFLNETVLFQFARPIAPLVIGGGPVGTTFNPSLDAMLIAVAGFAIPWYGKALIELVMLVVLLKVSDLSDLTRNSALFVLVSVFVLPDDFFWSYLELPFMLMLFWLSAPKSLAFLDRS
jgi:hypothetical protein